MHSTSRAALGALAAVAMLLAGCWPQACFIRTPEGALYCEDGLDSLFCYWDPLAGEDEEPVDDQGCGACEDSKSFTACEDEGFRYECHGRWYRTPCDEPYVPL
jgi:hypothetical protein